MQFFHERIKGTRFRNAKQVAFTNATPTLHQVRRRQGLPGHEDPGTQPKGAGHTIRLFAENPRHAKPGVPDCEVIVKLNPQADQQRFLNHDSEAGTGRTVRLS